jgi:hypothetical protein
VILAQKKLIRVKKGLQRREEKERDREISRLVFGSLAKETLGDLSARQYRYPTRSGYLVKRRRISGGHFGV